MPAKDKGCDEEIANRAKKLREDAKKSIDKLKKEYYSGNNTDKIKHISHSLKDVSILVELVRKFEKKYSEMKIKSQVIDFSDLERGALAILTENGAPSDAAREYRKIFREIMIDEYQDSNSVQEVICSIISQKDEKRPNMFMVGDVKQSIYGFRMANPEIFLSKYEEYAKNSDTGRKIDLSMNFRSRIEVLEPVNAIFNNIMTKASAGLDYNEAQSLKYGGLYGDRQDLYETELILVNPDAECVSEYFDAQAPKGFLAIADVVTEIMTQDPPFMVETDGEKRPVSFGDIAVLMRSVKGRAAGLSEVLEAYGIPSYCESTEGYFDTPEIQVLLSYLKIIDNPHQSIPLVSVMRSGIWNFSEEDLALIRLIDEKDDYFNCVKKAFESDRLDKELSRKVIDFTNCLHNFRRLSGFLNVRELLEEILRVTHFDAICASQINGDIKLSNIRELLNKARDFEKISYRGLFSFNRYVEKLREREVDFGEARPGSAGEGALTITSIHKSKGLEYPVVITEGLERRFNASDESAKILTDEVLGIGVDDYETDRRRKYRTEGKKAIAIKKHREMIAEEMRVLYVALTRAKEKLIMVGVRKEEDIKEQNLPENTSNYLDWIYIPFRDNLGKIRVFDEVGQGHVKGGVSKENLTDTENRDLTGMGEDSKELFEKEKERMYKEICDGFSMYRRTPKDIPEKFSVSEIKRLSMEDEDPDAAVVFAGTEDELYVPSFARQGKEDEPNILPGAIRGTAIHRIMECISFKSFADCDNVIAEYNNQIASLKERGIIDWNTEKFASEPSIHAFLECDLRRRMSKADLENGLFKEKRFVMGVEGSYLGYETDKDILIQGIVDAYFVEDGKIVLMDYKTDRVDSDEKLIARYGKQMELYKKAIEGAEGLAVKEAVLYSFCLNREIIVAL